MAQDYGSPSSQGPSTSTSPSGSTSSSGTQQITLGRYRLLQRIGRGGMGEVWLGEDPRLHRQVAIKTLPVHNQGDQEFLQRFEREARAAAALNHPHILPVHDFGEQPLANGQSITYLVMPFVQGGSLSDRIQWLMHNRAGMSQQEAIQFLGQAADAIDYAHAQGVIHRDIKPANMLLRADNWLMLADFGIARMLTEQSRLTQTGMGFGTPEYMAPEQAQGQAGAASDNYSLAVIAYELFTGRVPFRADTPYATTIQHIMTPPIPPRQINPAISPAVEQVLLQGLAKDPAQRPPSARTFVDMLQQAVTGSPHEATYFKPALPATGGVPFNTPAAFNSAPTSSPNMPNIPNTGTVPSSGGQGSSQQPGISRRNVLIGGSAALLVVAGVGVWAFAFHQNQAGGLPGHSTPGATGTARAHTQSSPTQGTTGSSKNPDFVLLGHNKTISGLAFSPSQQALSALASVGIDGQVIRWNIPALSGSMVKVQPLATQSPGSLDILLSLCWSPDGSAIAVGNANPGNGSVDFSNSYVAIYKSDLSANAFSLGNPLKVEGSNIVAGMAWAGRYLVTGVNLSSMNNTSTQLTSQYELFDPTTSANALGKSILPGYINDPILDPFVPMVASPLDSSLLAFAANNTDETVSIAKVQSGASPSLKIVANTSSFIGVSGVTWSNDGAFVAAYSDDHTLNASSIGIWDAKHNYSQVTPPQLPDNVSSNLRGLAWSPSTNHLLAAGDDQGNIYIWKFYPGLSGNGFPVATIPGTLKNVKQGKAEITALAWSNDGQWLAVGYNDINATIYVWNSSRWQG
ncbi:MAG TPA: WD40 repeat domain-containing serine/threonine protein kinase [Ktedonobacteraceae bacterium]|nr:WD40 repeat domain-containing serine/threonine protein kinase [Ktedonobacteraceae bacterium]